MGKDYVLPKEEFCPKAIIFRSFKRPLLDQLPQRNYPPEPTFGSRKEKQDKKKNMPFNIIIFRFGCVWGGGCQK